MGDFRDWQASGHDLHSVQADPMFANRDGANGTEVNLTFRAGSPALARGIQPVDVSVTGLLFDRPRVVPWVKSDDTPTTVAAAGTAAVSYLRAEGWGNEGCAGRRESLLVVALGGCAAVNSTASERTECGVATCTVLLYARSSECAGPGQEVTEFSSVCSHHWLTNSHCFDGVFQPLMQTRVRSAACFW